MYYDTIYFNQNVSIQSMSPKTNKQTKRREKNEQTSNCNETSIENDNDNATDNHRNDGGDEASNDT